MTEKITMAGNECDGSCDEHSGDVKRYRVVDPTNHQDWGHYWYCDEAVEEDKRRGFNLISEDD
jgi:hypothetical protein